MHPTLLFSWLHSYGLMLAVGFYAGWWLAARRGRQEGVDPDVVGNIVLISIVAGVAGSRLVWFWLLRDPRDPWWTLFKVWEGGLVFYGGLVGAVLANWLYLWWRKTPVWQMADIVAPSVALGQGFGRLGCFLNGCCYGGACTEHFALGVPFPAFFGKSGAVTGSPVFLDHLTRRWVTDASAWSLAVHPTQLYAAMSLLTIAALVVAATPYRRRRGELLAMVMMLNALSRLGIELVRRDAEAELLGMTAGQLGALVILAAGIALFTWARRRGQPAAPTPA